MKKLTKPQLSMLQKARTQGFVLAPASVPTAWILERRGMLERVKMWTVNRVQVGRLVKETYQYELKLTAAGLLRLEAELAAKVAT